MRPASVEFPLVTCQGSDGLRHASVVSRDSQQNRLTMAVPAPTRQNTTGCERPLTTNDKSGNNQPPTDRPVSLIACHHSQPTITATTIDSLIDSTSLVANCHSQPTILTHRTAAERVRCVHIVSPHSQPTIRTPTTNQRTALHTIDCEPPLTTKHLDDCPPCTRRTRMQPIVCRHSQPTTGAPQTTTDATTPLTDCEPPLTTNNQDGTINHQTPPRQTPLGQTPPPTPSPQRNSRTGIRLSITREP